MYKYVCVCIHVCTQVYICVCVLTVFYSIPTYVIKDCGAEFPVLRSRPFLVFCFAYGGVCMSTPVPQFLPHPFPLGDNKLVFYICGSVCFVNRSICTIFIDSTEILYFYES